MANCNITKGKCLSKKNAVGGYRNAYFINYDDDIQWVSSASTTTSFSGISANEVFKYEAKATTNTLNQEVTTSRDNGTTFYTQTLALTIGKISVDMTQQLKYMIAGRPFVVVEDNMGNFLLLGEKNGVDVTAATVATGGGLGDFNGYNITFTAEERDLATHLSPAAVTALLALVADNVCEDC